MDLVAEELEHAADLAVASFMDGDFHTGQVRLRVIANIVDIGRGRHAVLQLDAVCQVLQDRIGNAPFDLDFISLVDEAAGMHEDVGQFTVIGHDQQAFRILVQAADGVDAVLFLPEIVHDRRPALVIARRGDDALGLVEQIIMLRLRFQGLAVDGNAVLVGVDFRPQFADDDAVDADAPF